MAPPASFVTKIKVQLKLAIARLRMVQQRDEALSKTQRRTMAQLLDAGKYDSARIRVENIIRSDIITELHELLELYCELLLARAGLLESPHCDPGLEEAIKSVMYAAPKTESKELQLVSSMLAGKYGKEFAVAATENSDGKVSDKVVKKLSVTPPRKELVQGYLEEIAAAYNVDWPKKSTRPATPPENLIDDIDGGDDNDGGDGGGGGGLKEAPLPALPAGAMKDLMDLEEEEKKVPGLADDMATPKKDAGPSGPAALTVSPPSPSTENIHPRVTLNSIELRSSAKSGEDELDALAARFAALKKP